RDRTVTGVQTCALPIYLRHTNSTWLKDLGVPDRDIQAMLGHSNGAMTKHYQHGNPETSRQATALIAEVLQGNANLATVVNFGRRSEERRVGKECRYGRP